MIMLSRGRSGKSSATAATLASSTAVTMIRNTNPNVLQACFQYITNM